MIAAVREWLLGPPVTSDNQRGRQFFEQPRDLPVFSFRTVRQMLHDPTIKLGLEMRLAPLYQAEFAYKDDAGEWVPGVKCENQEVAEFIDTQLQRIWQLYLGKILQGVCWGWSAGEITYKLIDHRVHLDRILSRQAEYVWPLLLDTEVKGVRFKGYDGQVDLRFPKAFWFAFNAESESPLGRSICRGAYSPWADKNLEGGGLGVRRLFMHKDGYGGIDMTYPPGVTDIGKGDPVPNRDIAREVVEQLKAGGVTTRPAEYDQQGKPLWELTRATVPANPAHILQYPKDLDTEILRGLGIPDDVLMSDAGGAWQGKQVPMQMFYTNGDVLLAQVVQMLSEQILMPLIVLNFGQEIPFEASTKPLAEQAMEQIKASEPEPAPQPQVQQLSLTGNVAEQMVGQGVVEASELVRAGREYLGGRFRGNGHTRLATAHAPAGGVTVGGKKFKGGEFIPSEVLEKATAEEKAAIEGKGGSDTRESVLSALKDKPLSLSELGKVTGLKGSGTGTGRPQDQPLNKLLIEMRDAGEIEAIERQFGEPSFKATGKEVAPEKQVEKLTGKEAVAQRREQQQRANFNPDQSRAKSGGEIGPNGEFYPGGAFIATTDLPKKTKRKITQSATRKVAIGPGEFGVPEPGKIAVFEAMAGTYFNHRDGEVNEQYLDHLNASEELRNQVKDAAERFMGGEQFVDVTEFPDLATFSDVARLLENEEPIPGVLIESAKAWFGADFEKIDPALTSGPARSLDELNKRNSDKGA